MAAREEDLLEDFDEEMASEGAESIREFVSEVLNEYEMPQEEM